MNEGMIVEKIALELTENQVVFIIGVLEAEQETLSGWTKNLDPEMQAELKGSLGEAISEITSYMHARVNEYRIINEPMTDYEDYHTPDDDRDPIEEEYYDLTCDKHNTHYPIFGFCPPCEEEAAPTAKCWECGKSSAQLQAGMFCARCAPSHDPMR